MEIYLIKDGVNYGPYTADRVIQYLAAGAFRESDLAWHNESNGWVPLREVVALIQKTDSDSMSYPEQLAIRHIHCPHCNARWEIDTCAEGKQSCHVCGQSVRLRPSDVLGHFPKTCGYSALFITSGVIISVLLDERLRVAEMIIAIPFVVILIFLGLCLWNLIRAVLLRAAAHWIEKRHIPFERAFSTMLFACTIPMPLAVVISEIVGGIPRKPAASAIAIGLAVSAILQFLLDAFFISRSLRIRFGRACLVGLTMLAISSMAGGLGGLIFSGLFS